MAARVAAASRATVEELRAKLHELTAETAHATSELEALRLQLRASEDRERNAATAAAAAAAEVREMRESSALLSASMDEELRQLREGASRALSAKQAADEAVLALEIERDRSSSALKIERDRASQLQAERDVAVADARSQRAAHDDATHRVRALSMEVEGLRSKLEAARGQQLSASALASAVSRAQRSEEEVQRLEQLRSQVDSQSQAARQRLEVR